MVEAAQPIDKAALVNGEEFDQARWISQLTYLADNHDKCDIEVFCYFFMELCNLFKLMSKAMSLAFQDIMTKAKNILANKEFHSKQGQADACKSLQDFIKMEIGMNVHILNGKDNKKKVTDKKSWQYEYASTARTALRDMWMLDYLFVMLGDLVKFPEKKMKDISKNAYDVALGPHHPLLIRKTASVAVAAVPSKEDFLKKANISD